MALFKNDDSIHNRTFLRTMLVRLYSGIILTVLGGIVTAIVIEFLSD